MVEVQNMTFLKRYYLNCQVYWLLRWQRFYSQRSPQGHWQHDRELQDVCGAHVLILTIQKVGEKKLNAIKGILFYIKDICKIMSG